jgi:hypothetical protein
MGLSFAKGVDRYGGAVEEKVSGFCPFFDCFKPVEPWSSHGFQCQ